MITVGTNSCGENLYKVLVGTGTAWLQEFQVYAYNEQEAVDLVADYCEDNELHGLYSDFYELYDLCEVGETVDEYIETHSLICCGNHGIYMDITGIWPVK